MFEIESLTIPMCCLPPVYHKLKDNQTLHSFRKRGLLMSRAEEILKGRKANRERLEKEARNLYQGFNELMKYCYKPGALDRKYKELMAVTAAVATRCIPCLANHTNNALSAGADREEVLEAAAIGVEFGGGPSFVVVRDHLLDFLDDLEPIG
jgi:AhpD family alkylhydroperoxidase